MQPFLVMVDLLDGLPWITLLYFAPYYLFLLVNSQTLTRSVAVEEMGTLLPQISYQSTMCAFLVLSHRLF